MTSLIQIRSVDSGQAEENDNWENEEDEEEEEEERETHVAFVLSSSCLSLHDNLPFKNHPLLTCVSTARSVSHTLSPCGLPGRLGVPASLSMEREEHSGVSAVFTASPFLNPGLSEIGPGAVVARDVDGAIVDLGIRHSETALTCAGAP